MTPWSVQGVWNPSSSEAGATSRGSALAASIFRLSTGGAGSFSSALRRLLLDMLPDWFFAIGAGVIVDRSGLRGSWLSPRGSTQNLTKVRVKPPTTFEQLGRALLHIQ